MLKAVNRLSNIKTLKSKQAKPALPNKKVLIF